jgi:rare lipoprotein A
MNRLAAARNALALTAASVLLLPACAARNDPFAGRPPIEPRIAEPPPVAPAAIDSAAALHQPAGPAAAIAADEGIATYYADYFDGRRTASGIVFRNSEMFAAHRTYPFGTIVRVTNLANDRSVILTVVDRGPNGATAIARRLIIDVSRQAAAELDFIRQGITPVRVEVLAWGAE